MRRTLQQHADTVEILDMTEDKRRKVTRSLLNAIGFTVGLNKLLTVVY
jgi:hypothetical protein